MPPHFSLEILFPIILQLEMGPSSANWDPRFSLAHGNLIWLSVLRGEAMRFRFASKFGWWIPSEAEECFDLEPWCALWQRPILPHPHPHALPTRSTAPCRDVRSAVWGFALMLPCWNAVKLAFLSPEARRSVMCLGQALDLPQPFHLGHTSLSSVSPLLRQWLSNENGNIHWQPKAGQQRGFPLKRGQQPCRF